MSAQDNFEMASKIEARLELVRHAKEPKRILTFPSVKGDCARLFRQTWEDSEIIGIDMSVEVIKQGYDLVAKNILNEYYKVDFGQLIDKWVPWKITNINKNKDRNPTPKLSRVSITASAFDYGKFDLAYIDYCGRPTEARFSQVKKFVTDFTNIGGTVGVTFSLDEKYSPKDIEDKLVDGVSTKLLKSHIYETKCSMILVIIEKVQ